MMIEFICTILNLTSLCCTQSWDLKPLLRELQGAGHHSRYQSGAGAVPAATLGHAAATAAAAAGTGAATTGGGSELLSTGQRDTVCVQWAASSNGTSSSGGSGAPTSRLWPSAAGLKEEEQKKTVEFPLPRLAVWRAHHEAITALDWLPVDSSGKPAVAAAPVSVPSRPATAGRTGTTSTARPPAETAAMGREIMGSGVLGAAAAKVAAEGKGLARGYVVSAAFDCCLCLWAPDGVAVGTFGRENWQLENPSSWKAQGPVPLTVRWDWSNWNLHAYF